MDRKIRVPLLEDACKLRGSRAPIGALIGGPPGMPGRPRPAEPNDNPEFGTGLLLESADVVWGVMTLAGTPKIC